MPRPHPTLFLPLAFLTACTAKPARTDPAPPPPQVQATTRSLPSLSEERARPAANAPVAPSQKALPSLEDERARLKAAPVQLPDSPPAAIAEASKSYPEWWLTSVQLADGRYAACAEAEGVSFLGARQAALDQGVAALRDSLKAEPQNLSTDRITSVQSGGVFKVRVRVSCSAP